MSDDMLPTHWKPLTLDEILAMPPEAREQAYRRGYYDGFGAALDASKWGSWMRVIPQWLYLYWREHLLEWVKRAEKTDEFELPPAIAIYRIEVYPQRMKRGKKK